VKIITKRKQICKIGDIEFVIRGALVRTIVAKEEWDVDIDVPEAVIAELKFRNVGADLFTFMQRLPLSAPKYPYWAETENVAAIPISSYEHWWVMQVSQEARNKIRKSIKRGVAVRIDTFNDDLVRCIKEVYDDSPIRQGEKFLDYQIPFDEVKRGNMTYLDRAVFLGAYHGDELVGFLKIVFTKGYARTMGILGKISQRDKSPTSALVAKAVEVCAKNSVPYLTYGKFIYGSKGADSLTSFKRDLGFQKFDLPRYYVPLTFRGKLFLFLGIHRPCNELLPSWLVRSGLKIRRQFFKSKYSSARFPR
jgi:hypothetical protein